VVHLGIGAFHRAHQAATFDDLGWGIRAASLRSPGVRDAMAPQDYLYSLVVDETDEPDAFGCSCGTSQCRGTMLAAP